MKHRNHSELSLQRFKQAHSNGRDQFPSREMPEIRECRIRDAEEPKALSNKIARNLTTKPPEVEIKICGVLDVPLLHSTGLPFEESTRKKTEISRAHHQKKPCTIR